MNKVFFISDTHFGHSNIIKFEPVARPFETIEEHDEKLVDNWNSVVNKNDIVWHLGDFSMSQQAVNIAARLNGTKHLVMGNHDTAPTATYLKYFYKLHGVASYKGYILTHVPVHQQKHRYKGNIHGHLHSKRVRYEVDPKLIGTEMGYDPWYLNCSVEQINLTPILFEELIGRNYG